MSVYVCVCSGRGVGAECSSPIRGLRDRYTAVHVRDHVCEVRCTRNRWREVHDLRDHWREVHGVRDHWREVLDKRDHWREVRGVRDHYREVS